MYSKTVHFAQKLQKFFFCFLFGEKVARKFVLSVFFLLAIPYAVLALEIPDDDMPVMSFSPQKSEKKSVKETKNGQKESGSEDDDIPVMSFGTSASDNQEAAELSSIVVEGGKVEKTDPRKVKKNADDMSKEMIADEHDLLRNEVGVSVNEGGRSGSNGYSMRGVDADRVAITVDNMPQAESFLSFIYTGWGYMSGNRNTTEFENLSAVTVAKGADAFKVGSGALGGAVMFRTKEVNDFVRPGKHIGILTKFGYDSKNNQTRRVIGGGYRLDKLEGLMQYTHRNAHEMKTYSDNFPDVYGSRREIPDPEKGSIKSVLAKIGYNVLGDHWFRVSLESRDSVRNITEKSFGLSDHRYVEEFSPYARYGLDWEWMPSATVFETAKLHYGYQEIEQHAVSTNKDVDWMTKKEKSGISQKYDRLITQKLNSVELEAKTKNLLLGGKEHIFLFGSQLRTSKFKNMNHDINEYGLDKNYVIITPVKTVYYNLRLQDTVFWSDEFETSHGIRFDSYKHRALKDEILNPSFNEDALPEGAKVFAAPTWYTSLAYHLTPSFTVQYKIGSAFRAPKALEMYFRFGKDDFSANQVHPNPDLKPETALNQEIAFMFESSLGSATLTGFMSRYRNFIEDRNWLEKVVLPPMYGGGDGDTNNFQFVNIDRAKIYGVELASVLNTHEMLDVLPLGTSMSLSASWQKGDTNLGDGIRALQPLKAVLGVGYDSPRGFWGVKMLTRYLGAKKAEETKKTEFGYYGPRQKEFKYLNDAAYVSDLRFYMSPVKNLMLSIGINNLFDKKYFTWDRLRSIPEFGSTNMVDSRTGQGLNRFSEPGRNYSVMVQYKF